MEDFPLLSPDRSSFANVYPPSLQRVGAPGLRVPCSLGRKTLGRCSLDRCSLDLSSLDRCSLDQSPLGRGCRAEAIERRKVLPRASSPAAPLPLKDVKINHHRRFTPLSPQS